MFDESGRPREAVAGELAASSLPVIYAAGPETACVKDEGSSLGRDAVTVASGAIQALTHP